MKERIREKLKTLPEDPRVRRWIILLGIVGIALIVLSNFLPFSSNGNGQTEGDTTAQTERRLEELLSHIEGAGRTRVLLTADDAQQAYPLYGAAQKEGASPVRGVLVLCEGGGDPVTVERVSEAVSKALAVSSAKIYIAKLSE